MGNPKTPPSLHELQSWMKWIVTDPRGVNSALSDPFPSLRPNFERYTSPSKNGLPWISETSEVSRSVRLDIYAEAYFLRLLESMKSDFSITAQILGDVSFQKLVSDYLKQHPSSSASLADVGRYFSKFAGTYSDLKHVRFLEPVIEMEWLFIESFYADDSEFLDSSLLVNMSDEDWETAKFILAPSVFLIESTWPLDLLSAMQTEDFDFAQLTEFKTPHGFLMSRKNGNVSLEPVAEAQFALIEKLKLGESLISSLEQVQVLFPDNDIGSEIMNWFNEWVSRGIISDLKLKKQKEDL